MADSESKDQETFRHEASLSALVQCFSLCNRHMIFPSKISSLLAAPSASCAFCLLQGAVRNAGTEILKDWTMALFLPRGMSRGIQAVAGGVMQEVPSPMSKFWLMLPRLGCEGSCYLRCHLMRMAIYNHLHGLCRAFIACLQMGAYSPWSGWR